jgi:hypothetical protein
MGENQKKILEMLAAGKISVDEAQRLLSLVGGGKTDDQSAENVRGGAKTGAKYLYVVVEPKPGAHWASEPPEPPSPPEPGRPGVHRGYDYHGRVHVRVPFGLIRAGMKLTSLIPPEAADKVNGAMRDKGINFDVRHIKEEDIEGLISALCDSEINVDSDFETVRIYAE